MAKFANLLKGKLTLDYEQDGTKYYDVHDDYELRHKGEDVISIDDRGDGTVLVCTVQGLEHIGEFFYKIDDDLPIRAYKAC